MTTFGLELEICANKTKNDVIDTLARKNIPITLSQKHKPETGEWKIMHDISIFCGGKNKHGKLIANDKTKKTYPYSMEIVSPILTDYIPVKNLFKAMKQSDIVVTTNRTHAFHIHLSNDNLQKMTSKGMRQVTRFLVNFYVFEPLFRHLHPRRRSLRSNVKYLNRQKDFDNLNIFNDYSYKYLYDLFNPYRPDENPNKAAWIDRRYAAVNLQNLDPNKHARKGTIEIRNHKGTVSLDDVLSWTDICKKIFEKDTDARILSKSIFNKKFTRCTNSELSKLFSSFIMI